MKYLVFSFSFFLSFLNMNAQKDSIILASKSILLGEIKKMDKGVLVFKTVYSDSDFRIKWSEVKQMFSTRKFIIDLSNGQRIIAQIDTDIKDIKNVNLDAGGFMLQTKLQDIIYLDPTGDKLYKKIDASFEVGLTVAKASNLRQIAAGAGFGFQTKKWAVSSAFDYTFSQQDSVENVRRVDGSIALKRLLPKEWFIQISGDFLSSSELGLELRSTAKIGPGYYLKHTNSSAFAIDTGFALNHETYSSENDDKKSSYEVFAGLAFEKYPIDDFSILTSLNAFPSITEKGRFRTDIKLDLKYDFFSDFYISLGWTYNFDNQPAENSSKGDYVFKTTIGWELD
jgi:hypothetical protein